MAMREEDVETLAMELGKASRARLAKKLLVSVDEEDEIESAWAEEVERRVREIDAGEVELIPGDQVMDEIRSLLK